MGDADIDGDAKALMPWWRKPLPVAAITAILAAIVPATTAVSGIIQKNREVALQKLKQEHDASMEELKLRHTIQMDYLQHMGTEEDKARLLRIVIATSGDKALVSWARGEKDEVDKTIDRAEKRAAEAENQAKLAEENLAATEHNLATKTQETEQERKTRLALQAEVFAKVSELAAKKAELERLQPGSHKVTFRDVVACNDTYDACVATGKFGNITKFLCEGDLHRCLTTIADALR